MGDVVGLPIMQYSNEVSFGQTSNAKKETRKFGLNFDKQQRMHYIYIQSQLVI